MQNNKINAIRELLRQGQPVPDEDVKAALAAIRLNRTATATAKEAKKAKAAQPAVDLAALFGSGGK